MILRFIIFFAVIISLWAGAHLYIGVRILAPLHLHKFAKIVAWSIMTASFSVMPITLWLRRFKSTGWSDVLEYIGYGYLGFFSILLVLFLVKDISWGILNIFNISSSVYSMPVLKDPERRAFLTNLVHGGVVGVSGLLTLWGVVQARRLAKVTAIDIPIKNLHPDLEGFRIVQISDLHVGPTIGRHVVQAIVDAVNALQPDLIAVTGDLVDGSVAELRDSVAPIASLKAPYGAFFVTGNHEYYSGAENWCRHVAELGIEVLNDRHVMRECKQSRLVIAGVTDLRAYEFVEGHVSDAKRAMANAPPCDFRLLLAHQPNSAVKAAEVGFDLQLSGHTHGGQYFPFTWIIYLAQRFVKGLHRYKDMWIYVNRGTTYWGPPLRIGSNQEISLLRLTRGF